MTMRLRHVTMLNPPVPGLSRRAAGTEISFLPLESIWADGRFDPSRTIEFSGDVQSYNPVAEGDVLVPKVSPTFAHGRSAVAEGLTNGRALATSEVFVLRPRDPEAARFVKYRLLASDFLTEGQAAWAGVAGLKRVSGEFVRSTPIDAAAWKRRVAIADFLDRECAQIGSGLGEIEGLEAALDDPALAAFADLTAGRRPSRVGYHYEVLLGKMLDDAKQVGVAVPYLRNQNVQWDRFDLSDIKTMRITESEKVRYRVERGDLLACEGRHVGKCAIWDGSGSPIYYQKALHRIRPRRDWSNRYLLWCLWLGNRRGDFYADGTGSTIPHLPAEKLRAVRIPSVDPADQDRIVRSVDLTHRQASKARAALMELSVRLREYRNALITEAVTGKLDVTKASESRMAESLAAVSEGERPEVLSS